MDDNANHEFDDLEVECKRNVFPPLADPVEETATIMDLVFDLIVGADEQIQRWMFKNLR